MRNNLDGGGGGCIRSMTYIRGEREMGWRGEVYVRGRKKVGQRGEKDVGKEKKKAQRTNFFNSN